MKRIPRLLSLSLIASLPAALPACLSARSSPADTAAVTEATSNPAGADAPVEQPAENEAPDATKDAAPDPAPAAEPAPPPAAPKAEAPAKRAADESLSFDAKPTSPRLQVMTSTPAGSAAVAQSRAMGEAERRAARPMDKRKAGPAQQPGLMIAVDGEEADDDGATLEGGEFVSAGINDLIDPNKDALSTFAADVDTGSYSLARRYLLAGSLPPQHGVRVEEWVNAFRYSYADASREHPFSIHIEGAPLSKNSHVVRIGIQGKRIAKEAREPTHLTFLVDVSGSMSGADRLPLAKQALSMLVSELNDKDSVSLVTYAGNTSVVLPATRVTDKNRARIFDAIGSLGAGGGTAMGSGMELAYREATKALADKGSSRVIVLSDGDANIGRTGHSDILASIKGYVSEGVTMSTVGFGTGNYRDHLMEQLADAGNGNYSYVGSMSDAKKIFVDNLTGTLQVIAKDTKIQVEMNPAVVERYRLIGYENRDVRDQDFRNDKVDAGEIGAGHTVTALYEVVLKEEATAGQLATVRVRYKEPKGVKATEVATTFTAQELKGDVRQLTADGRFAVGMGLAAESFRGSPHMARLGLNLADAHALMSSAIEGAHAEERREIAGLIAPLAGGTGVATR